MKNTLIFVFCLICFGCSSANTQIAENSDHNWIPCGGGMGFCTKLEKDPPYLCKEYTNIGTSFIHINGKTYIFIDSYCVAPAGSANKECPYGYSNRPAVFDYNTAELIKARWNEPYEYDGRLRFVDDSDSNNLQQICDDRSSSLVCLRDNNDIARLKSICDAWIWTGEKRKIITIRAGIIDFPMPMDNAVVLVFK